MKANENSRIALFTGTFDPFTTGHASVVRRALPLFDHLVIAVAVSERKHTQEEISERVAAIASLYEDDPRVSVRPYSDLTIDMARREPAGRHQSPTERRGDGLALHGARSPKRQQYLGPRTEVLRP